MAAIIISDGEDDEMELDLFDSDLEEKLKYEAIEVTIFPSREIQNKDNVVVKSLLKNGASNVTAAQPNSTSEGDNVPDYEEIEDDFPLPWKIKKESSDEKIDLDNDFSSRESVEVQNDSGVDLKQDVGLPWTPTESGTFKASAVKDNNYQDNKRNRHFAQISGTTSVKSNSKATHGNTISPLENQPGYLPYLSRHVQDVDGIHLSPEHKGLINYASGDGDVQNLGSGDRPVAGDELILGAFKFIDADHVDDHNVNMDCGQDGDDDYGMMQDYYCKSDRWKKPRPHPYMGKVVGKGKQSVTGVTKIKSSEKIKKSSTQVGAARIQPAGVGGVTIGVGGAKPAELAVSSTKVGIQHIPGLKNQRITIWKGHLAWTNSKPTRIYHSLECSLTVRLDEEIMDTSKWPKVLKMKPVNNSIFMTEKLQPFIKNGRRMVLNLHPKIRDAGAVKSLYSNIGGIEWCGVVSFLVDTGSSMEEMFWLKYSEETKEFVCRIFPSDLKLAIKQAIRQVITERKKESRGRSGLPQGGQSGLPQGGQMGAELFNPAMASAAGHKLDFRVTAVPSRIRSPPTSPAVVARKHAFNADLNRPAKRLQPNTGSHPKPAFGAANTQPSKPLQPNTGSHQKPAFAVANTQPVTGSYQKPTFAATNTHHVQSTSCNTVLHTPLLVGSSRIPEAPPPLECEACRVMRSHNSVVQCCDGHVVCTLCVEKEAKLVIVGTKKGSVACSVVLCNSSIPQSELRKSLPSIVLDLLEESWKKETLEALENMKDGVKCPCCGYSGVLDTNIKNFKCVKCQKTFCRLCEMEWHVKSHNLCIKMTKKVSEATGHTINIPAHWTLDPDREKEMGYSVEQLDGMSEEYLDILTQFTKSLYRDPASTFTVNKIYRVQNQRLWEKYSLFRTHMGQDVGEIHIHEKRLFHGTRTETIESICKEGFDWRLCGKHGTLYGQGTYFAKDSGYSVRYSFVSSKPWIPPDGQVQAKTVKTTEGGTSSGPSFPPSYTQSLRFNVLTGKPPTKPAPVSAPTNPSNISLQVPASFNFRPSNQPVPVSGHTPESGHGVPASSQGANITAGNQGSSGAGSAVPYVSNAASNSASGGSANPLTGINPGCFVFTGASAKAKDDLWNRQLDAAVQRILSSASFNTTKSSTTQLPSSSSSSAVPYVSNAASNSASGGSANPLTGITGASAKAKDDLWNRQLDAAVQRILSSASFNTTKSSTTQLPSSSSSSSNVISLQRTADPTAPSVAAHLPQPVPGAPSVSGTPSVHFPGTAAPLNWPFVSLSSSTASTMPQGPLTRTVQGFLSGRVNRVGEDVPGLRYMFVGRVLVGRKCEGKSEMRRPGKNAEGLACHTAVDNLRKSRIYVVFESGQCYPEYLIEFSKESSQNTGNN